MYDGGGLCLYLSIAGTKSWQYRNKINGKNTTMMLGAYPGVGLAQA
ncbi:Arm DNA-binding domain-containing protein [Prosthecochloris aestuarii]